MGHGHPVILDHQIIREMEGAIDAQELVQFVPAGNALELLREKLAGRPEAPLEFGAVYEELSLFSL
jgi:hypothetical protein